MLPNNEILLLDDDSREKKDFRSRLHLYVTWLNKTARCWYLPDMEAYREFLLQERGLQQSSARPYISAVRSRLSALLEDPNFESIVAAALGEDNPLTVSEVITHIKEAIKPSAGRVEHVRSAEIRRLTTAQIEQLFNSPDVFTRQGLRDLSIMGLIFCAGLNESEVAALQVADLYYEVGGRFAVRVLGTGHRKERIVPIYDDVLWTRRWVSDCLYLMREVMKLTTGVLFSRFQRGDNFKVDKAITNRGVQKMLKSYEVRDTDEAVTITALDLRRAYARRLYLAGVELDTIQSNLSLGTRMTTLEYIGPPAPYTASEDTSICSSETLRSRLIQRRGKLR